MDWGLERWISRNNAAHTGRSGDSGKGSATGVWGEGIQWPSACSLGFFPASLHLDNHRSPSKIAFLCIRTVAHSDQVFTCLQHNLLNVSAVVAQNAKIGAHFLPSLPLALLSPLEWSRQAPHFIRSMVDDQSSHLLSLQSYVCKSLS